MLVSSVPLSETTVSGAPRRPMMASSSRATRLPDSEVSATRPRHSRVKSSTTVRMRNRRPSVSASLTKSSDQRWFGPCSSAAGARVPSACLRPLLVIEPQQLQQLLPPLWPAAGRAADSRSGDARRRAHAAARAPARRPAGDGDNGLHCGPP